MTSNASSPSNAQGASISTSSGSLRGRTTPASRSPSAVPADDDADTTNRPISSEPSGAPPRRVAFLLPEGPHSFADTRLQRRIRPRRLAPPTAEVETAAIALANGHAMIQELSRARALYAMYQLDTLCEQWQVHEVDTDAAFPQTLMPRPNPQLEQKFTKYENAVSGCSSAIRRVKRCLSPLNDVLDRHATFQLSDRTSQDESLERTGVVKRQCIRDADSQSVTSDSSAPNTVPAQAFRTVNDPAPVPPRYYHITKDRRAPLKEVTVVLDSDDDNDGYVMSPFNPSCLNTPERGHSPPEQVTRPIEDIPENERCLPCRMEKRPVSPHREIKCEYRCFDYI